MALTPRKLQIEAAEKYYKAWKSYFRCEVLEKYYEGFQWNVRAVNYQPYTLNMVYSTIKIKLANIIYQRPEFQVTPVPQFSNWDQEFAIENAYLKQDTLNTIIGNKKVKFVETLRLAALDSFFRFAVVEIGYAADWRNPGAIPFVANSEGKIVNREEAKQEIPLAERIFFKHIKASRFRVAPSDASDLEKSPWCGYYDYRYRSDLQNTKGIKLPKQYKMRWTAADYGDLSSYIGAENKSPEMWKAISSGEVLKVWHIWDNFEKTTSLYLDNHFDEPIFEDMFERLPFSTVRWDYRAPSLENSNSTGWYPIPPVFQWISSQDEINRTREQLRNYRRRFTRKWWYIKGAIDPTELEKLKTEEDGLAIEMKRPDAVGAISNPEIGAAITDSLSINMSDLNLITGTSAQARAQSDRQTATETKAIQIREQIRESVEQMDFDTFVVDCGREALLQVKERFTEGMWVKDTSEKSQSFLQEMKAMQLNYKYVTSQDLDDGYDEDISVNVVNASPQKMEDEKQKFLQFITLMQQMPQLSMDPDLIRETAYRCGYRNEKIIRKMQQAALLHMMSQAAQMQQQQGGSPLQAQGQQPQQTQQLNAAPNPTNEIQAQLAGQVG